MRCPFCRKPGLKKLKGYCCKAHRRLDKRPPKKTIACRGCGAPQRRSPSAVSRTGIVYCKTCKRGKGENHYRFKEGSYIDRAGYRMVLRDGRYVKEHRLEWEKANEACLLSTGTIHHVRFDLPHNKTYNDPDNLLLLSSTEHSRFHRLFDLEYYEKAFEILLRRAKMQLHYPQEVHNFIEAVLGNVDGGCDSQAD